MEDSGGWRSSNTAQRPDSDQLSLSLRNHLSPDTSSGQETHSVCPRQKDSMLCGAKAQLTRIFSSRSAVRT